MKNKKDNIIAALEKTQILGIGDRWGGSDYLIHSWDIGADESDFALAFSYTDYEGMIYEFAFTWESINDAVLFPGGFSLKDDTGEMVDIQLYGLEAINVTEIS